MNSSKVSLADSSYGNVSPGLPSIRVAGLSKPLAAVSGFNVTVTGSDLVAGSLSASMDGATISLKVNATSTGLFATGKIDPTALNDGVHALSLIASQSDGLSSALSSSFSTDAHQQAISNETSLLLYLAVALAAVAVIALVIGTLAFRRTRVGSLLATPAAAQV